MDKLPSGIIKRGAKFRVSVMVAGERETATCKTLDEATQTKQKFLLGLADAANPVEKKVWTLQDGWDHYIDYKVANGKVNYPHNNHKIFVWYGKTITEYFGENILLDELSKVRVAEFFDFLTIEKGYGSSCTNYIGTLLHQMQIFAQKRGRKRIDPVRMEYRKPSKGRIRFVTSEEELQILEWFVHTGRQDFADLFAFYLDTGLRKSEALRLKFDDVDMTTGKIMVWKTKNGEPRHVVMTPRVRSIIASLKLRTHNSQDAGNCKVFAGINVSRFYLDWALMRRALGFKSDLVIHSLRHSCCTRLVSAGVDLRSVMQWMGHSSIVQTQRYAHFIPNSLQDAADALDNLARAAKQGDTVTKFRPIKKV